MTVHYESMRQETPPAEFKPVSDAEPLQTLTLSAPLSATRQLQMPIRPTLPMCLAVRRALVQFASKLIRRSWSITSTMMTILQPLMAPASDLPFRAFQAPTNSCNKSEPSLIPLFAKTFSQRFSFLSFPLNRNHSLPITY